MLLLNRTLIRLHFIIVFYFLNAALSTAQGKYCLIRCPQSTGVDKISFNKKYEDTSSDEAYSKIIRETFVAMQQGEANYRVKRENGKVEYFKYVPGGHIQKSDLSSLSSKGKSKNIIESQEELKRFFSDTVAILSGIKVRIRISETNFDKKGYFFLCEGEGGKVVQVPIPSVRDTIVIHPEIFSSFNRDVIQVVLMNSAKPNVQLASCVFHLVNEYDAMDIRDLVCDLINEKKVTHPFDIASHVNLIVDGKFGKVTQSDMIKIKCTR